MKAIMVDNRILSLENVKEVQFCESGTGSQRNPFYYHVLINYMNGESANSEFISNKEKVKEWFNKIFEIITAE